MDQARENERERAERAHRRDVWTTSAVIALGAALVAGLAGFTAGYTAAPGAETLCPERPDRPELGRIDGG